MTACQNCAGRAHNAPAATTTSHHTPKSPHGERLQQQSLSQHNPRRNKMPEPIKANCCSATWTGLTAAHCTSCHHTFTSPSGFDAHRRDNQCQPPATLGMVPANREWDGWSYPGTWTGPAA